MGSQVTHKLIPTSSKGDCVLQDGSCTTSDRLHNLTLADGLAAANHLAIPVCDIGQKANCSRMQEVQSAIYMALKLTSRSSSAACVTALLRKAHRPGAS